MQLINNVKEVFLLLETNFYHVKRHRMQLFTSMRVPDAKLEYESDGCLFQAAYHKIDL